ncbi:YhgE/Pip domain-containing protein [Leucobacter zeae]|nr:YhgE/Pip domain-containing protein [Leucobacter zeae]
MTRSKNGLPLARIRGRRPVTWTTILGLVLVPLTVAGVLVWGLWNPTDRLASVTAAVVNDDEPVELDGQTVPLGRLLAGELVGGGEDPADAAGSSDASDANFTWVLTDADDAQEGLEDGRYSTVVTIPKNFSAAATSTSGAASGDDDARVETAHIEVQESDRGRLIDTALSGIVTQTATTLLNQQLGSQFVGGVFVGMNELGAGIGDAADGATQLADGGKQLADGATQLADGTEQLADGTGQLADGASQLWTGVGQLSSGAGELAGGASQLSGGASELAGGVQLFVNGDGKQNPGLRGYVGGASDLNAGYKPLAAGTVAVVDEFRGLLDRLQRVQAEAAGPSAELSAGLAAAGAGAQGLGADIPGLVEQCAASGAEQAFCDTLQVTLGSRAQEIGAGLTTAGTGAQNLGTVMGGLQGDSGGNPQQAYAKLDELQQGVTAFSGGLAELAGNGEAVLSGASQLVDGSAALASGASGLSSGAAQLAGGTSQLSDGASQLATGTSELAANTPELAKGASQLADGAGKSADGAGDLAKGLGEAAAGIPTTTDDDREKLAETAVAPVEARGGSDQLFNASGVPLFAGVALWAGALASFLVLSPLWRRTRDAARGVGAITLRSVLPAALLGAVQGVIAGVVLPIVLGYDLAQGSRFFALAVLAGVAFALVVQGLAALLGGVGRFIAFALLVVAFAVGIVSTVPGPLVAVGSASPIGAALDGFQAVASGAAGSGAAAAVLALWALAGVVLTALGVARARRTA